MVEYVLRYQDISFNKDKVKTYKEFEAVIWKY